MLEKENWRWTFYGFESSREGKPVQTWFDSLLKNDRFEIIDLLEWLRIEIKRPWRPPQFDPLEGESGISEIRIPEIRSAEGSVFYRIYGCFGVGSYARSYIFLHGTDKKVKNDVEGKGVARRRFGELVRREATFHKFDFQESLNRKVDDRTRGKG